MVCARLVEAASEGRDCREIQHSLVGPGTRKLCMYTL